MAGKNKDSKGSFISEFNENPTEQNWDKFKKLMKKDRARYYYVVHPHGLKNKMNLKNAYAVIYDGKFRQMYKVPIIKKTKEGIIGATIYLKELEVNRKAI